jgi:hypothetical protein
MAIRVEPHVLRFVLLQTEDNTGKSIRNIGSSAVAGNRVFDIVRYK